MSVAAGCVFVVPDDQPAEAHFAAARELSGPDAEAPRLPPLETRRFAAAESTEFLGEAQVLFARYENTFAKIAREYNVGYDALRRANPGVDDWLPGEGTPVYLPTSSILPSSPRSAPARLRKGR